MKHPEQTNEPMFMLLFISIGHFILVASKQMLHLLGIGQSATVPFGTCFYLLGFFLNN